MNNSPRIFSLLLLLVLATAVSAQAQTERYDFHWAPSPDFDDEGRPLPAAVEYQVWLQRDADQEELIATVVGDTIYSLLAEAGVVHRLRVRGIDASGRTSPMSAWSDPVYFEDDGRTVLVPLAPELDGNYPNPFNPETRIVYGVPETVSDGDAVHLEIYNVKGVRVRSLAVERTPGWHETVWDGKNDRGQAEPTGVYLTRFLCGNLVRTSKMTMVK